MLHNVADILAEVHVASLGVLVPPVGEGQRRGALMLELPVQLRQLVVYPALLRPQQHVGVEVVVVLQAVGLAAAGVAFLVAPDAEGADAEAYPGLFGRGDFGVYLLDEQVDVVAAPVGLLHPVAVFGKRLLVGEVGAAGGVGVEVVVEVDAVDIVAVDDVHHHVLDELAVLGQTRVEVNFLVALIFYKALRLFVVNMSGGKLLGGRGGDAVRVEPGVQLHAALVRLVDHKLQWVPVRRGRLAALGEETAPGLEFAGVEGVGAGTYLEEDGVDSGGFELVELVGEIALQLGGALLCILALVDGVQPGAAELALGVGGLCRAAQKGDGGSHYENSLKIHRYRLLGDLRLANSAKSPFSNFC